MGYYFTRSSGAITAATTTRAAMTLDSEGNTVAPYMSPPDVRKITSLTTVFVVDAAWTETGNNFVVEIRGDALVDGVQEIVVSSVLYNEGAGTLQSFAGDLVVQAVIPVDIDIKPNAPIEIAAYYVGADAGTQFGKVGLELE